MWVVMGRILRVLERMHRGAEKIILGKRVTFERLTGTCYHTLLYVVLVVEGLLPLRGGVSKEAPGYFVVLTCSSPRRPLHSQSQVCS